MDDVPTSLGLLDSLGPGGGAQDTQEIWRGVSVPAVMDSVHLVHSYNLPPEQELQQVNLSILNLVIKWKINKLQANLSIYLEVAEMLQNNNTFLTLSILCIFT